LLPLFPGPLCALLRLVYLRQYPPPCRLFHGDTAHAYLTAYPCQFQVQG